MVPGSMPRRHHQHRSQVAAAGQLLGGASGPSGRGATAAATTACACTWAVAEAPAHAPAAAAAGTATRQQQAAAASGGKWHWQRQHTARTRAQQPGRVRGRAAAAAGARTRMGARSPAGNTGRGALRAAATQRGLGGLCGGSDGAGSACSGRTGGRGCRRGAPRGPPAGQHFATAGPSRGLLLLLLVLAASGRVQGRPLLRLQRLRGQVRELAGVRHQRAIGGHRPGRGCCACRAVAVAVHAICARGPGRRHVAHTPATGAGLYGASGASGAAWVRTRSRLKEMHIASGLGRKLLKTYEQAKPVDRDDPSQPPCPTAQPPVTASCHSRLCRSL